MNFQRALLVLWVVCGSRSGFAGLRRRKIPAKARYFKGNLHTHSLWSDGDDFPEMIADWYKTKGYDFFSPHGTQYHRQLHSLG